MPARDQTFIVMRSFLLCVSIFLCVPLPASAQVPSLPDTEGSLALRVRENRNWLTDDAATQSLALEAYNVGTRLLEDDQPGKAHAWLSFARTLASTDAGIATNLTIARDRLQARIGRASLEPAKNEWETLLNREALQGLLDLICVFAMTLALGIGLWRRLSPNQVGSTIDQSPPIAPPPVLLLISGVGLVGLILSRVFLGGGTEYRAVLSEETVLRSGPGESFVSLSTLAPGVIVPVEMAREAKKGAPAERWLQIRHTQGALGWIPERTCLPLSKNWP